jgi:DNA-binding response OmpR family regulator
MVEVHIHSLRRKFCAGLIQTVRGLGYQMAPAVARRLET